MALRLSLDDATAAATASGGQTWSWRGCAAPWAAGDQLMLRLRHRATAPSDLANAPGCEPAPAFAAASYAFTVSERAAVGAAVGTVTATAADGDTVTYAITAGNAGDAFAIAADSGALTVAAALDYDSTTSYALTVTATDASGGAAEAAVAVMVTEFAVDYDTDDDGLIEVASLAQLHAIRWDLDGNGASTNARHAAAFPDAPAGMGCPATGCVGYELTTDLDFDTDGDGAVDADDAYWNGGAGWAPLGDVSAPFAAVFEGNGHTIARVFIDRDFDIGLFGYTTAASVIRRVGLTAIDIRGVAPVGGVVGWNEGAIRASYARGRVRGSGELVGGLVGLNLGVIAASYTGVDVTGDSNVGGLAGMNSGQISAGYAGHRVTATGAGRVGGLVGWNVGAITASYARGEVTGRGASGGLVGSNEGTVTASYWDTTTSGRSASDGGVGQTTGALQTPTGYGGIYAGWNVDVDGVTGGDDPWDFRTAAQYPVLRVDFDGDGAASWEEFGGQRANQAPGFTEATPTTRAVDENTAAGAAIGAPVTATDGDGGDRLVYTLGGADAAAFGLDADTGQLQTQAALDHETKASYAVTVAVSDGKGGRASLAVTITVNDVADTRPPAPANLAATPGATSVALRWDAVAGATTYRVAYRAAGTEAGDWTTADDTLTDTTYTVETLTCGTSYEFRVSAFGDGTAHAAEWGAASAALSTTTSACPSSPTFGSASYSFSVGEDAAVGAAVGTVTATAADGDTVTYAITAGNAGRRLRHRRRLGRADGGGGAEPRDHGQLHADGDGQPRGERHDGNRDHHRHGGGGAGGVAVAAPAPGADSRS